MALPQYNTQQLIANIKRRCLVPTSQFTFRNPDLTALANDELQGEVVPLIMSAREEFFVEARDVAAPSDGIIDFPGETVGLKLRSVCYVQQTNPLLLINLPRIDLDVVAGVGWNNYLSMAGFYVQNNQLHLYPQNSVPTNTTIRLYFFRRALDLVPPSEYAQITAINTGTLTLTLNRIPSSWAAGTQLNTVEQTPNFATTNPLSTITSISFPDIIVDNVDDMSVGDYVTEYGFSAIPQIPLESHAYLAQLTAAKCLEALGDREGMKAALDRAEKLKEYLLVFFSERVDGSLRKIVSPDGGMRLGAGLGRWGRGWSGGTF